MRFLLAGCLILLGCGTAEVREAGKVPDPVETAVGDAVHPRFLQEFDGVYSDPALSAYVGQVGEKMAAVVQRFYPRKLKYQFHILNSSMINVYTSLGGHVYITRGLLTLCMNEDQLAAALAHALVHAASGQTGIRISQEIALESLAEEIRGGGYVIGEPAAHAGTWTRLSQTALAVARITYPRDYEDLADSHALRLVYEAGYNPRGFIQFNETVEKRLMAAPRWTPYRNAHSAAGDRIADAEKTVKQYYPDGERRDFTTVRFEKAVAQLKAEAEAYDLFDQGCIALDKGDFAEAVERLSKAIDMKKSEALFYRSRGWAYFKTQNYRQAEMDFSSGLALSTAHESLYAGRALARIRLSRFEEAVDDLRWAARHVKRPETYFWLGDCCERARKPAEARQAYLNCLALAGYDAGQAPPEAAAQEIRQAHRRLSNLK